MEAKNLTVRPAIQADQPQLAGLIHTGAHIHRHLDWRNPLDWIGFPPFLVAEHAGRLAAVLACPPDPPGVSWIRLFTHADWLPITEGWWDLWKAVLSEFETGKGQLVGAISLHGWFEDVLHASRFTTRQQIVMLEWTGTEFEPYEPAAGLIIRKMTLTDVPAVAEVDAAAFDLLWQNSLPTLIRAFPQSAVSAVAELDGRIVGYQISTQNAYGLHLARLAVQPEVQGKRIGLGLVTDLLSYAQLHLVKRITVNTQSDNDRSLKLYQHAGFQLTGERYPVYEYRV